MNSTDQLINNLADTAQPLKPARNPFAVCARWTVGCILYITLITAITGIRPDFVAKLHIPLCAAECATLVSIFLTTALSAALLAFPDLHGKRRLACLPLFFFALFAFVLYREWLADNPPASPPGHDCECTIAIILYAALPGICLLRIVRRFATTHAMLTGSIVMLAAFSVGAIILRLCEQTDSITHLIEWHYLPMLAVGLLGLLLGKLFLKW
jgi:hypothetical protein